MSSQPSPSTSAQAMLVAERRLASGPKAESVMSRKEPLPSLRKRRSLLGAASAGERKPRPSNRTPQAPT